MELRGVVWGEMGGKRDWNIVVVRDSRCFGTAGLEFLELSEVEAGEVKLFMTRRGGERYSFPLPLGCFCAFCTSLHNEYFSTRKCRVGPRGVSASRRLVLPEVEREKSRRCDTPRGPAIVV